jgi:hypothetical protein
LSGRWHFACSVEYCSDVLLRALRAALSRSGVKANSGRNLSCLAHIIKRENHPTFAVDEISKEDQFLMPSLRGLLGHESPRRLMQNETGKFNAGKFKYNHQHLFLENRGAPKPYPGANTAARQRQSINSRSRTSPTSAEPVSRSPASADRKRFFPLSGERQW